MTKRKSKRSFVRESTSKPSSTRKHVICDCNICQGAEVDPRTKESHMKKREISRVFTDRTPERPSEIGTSRSHITNDPIIPMEMDEMEISYDSEDEQYDSRDKQKFNFLAKKTSKSKRKFNIDPFVLIEHLLSDHEDDDQEVEDDDVASIEDDDLEQNVNFDAPESGYGDDDSDTPNINIDQGFAWIVYWILKYQERYRLSDVATNLLIKFIRYLLISYDKNTYSTFPTSLYMARKLFGIGDQIIKYATCPTCCKLYSVNKLPTDKPSHCSFQNFPNHPMANYRSPCGAVITKQVPTNQGIIYRPALIFPIVNIKCQLQRLYNKKGFEESCRKWAARPNNDHELSDIYDGRIWKEFKDPNEDRLFFRHDVSDSNLGIMLNLDWFQPFDNSQHSVGVIYGVICNLPRSERFKTSNTITLAVIPGPGEPKLHKLNHYLAPIIDQFIELWKGIDISTNETSSKHIRAAIICCACDIPAARKLCGLISARAACHLCEKVANFDDRNQSNFGGFDDMNQWFVKRDADEIRNNAYIWKECNTEDARKNHVSETFVRWSEIYRLPYFDPTKFLIVDPMHCLFLGIAKWIVTRLWIEENRLTTKHLEIMQERVNKIKVPSDIGRIPNKIETGDGFSGFTANQWKTFILIYATTITWNLLKDEDRKILSYFVRACNILVCRIISKSGLNEAYQCLLSMVKLVEKQYGQKKITPNMHLCLHICECALDYGPLYSFWCYSFERMNGLLGNININI